MSAERVERRLAAVLAADVAGYSRLMGVDEEGTLARLKAVRKTLVDPAIASHRGRIVKTTGDGMLVEFASAVDAVRCSVEVQSRMGDQNVAVPQDRRLEFRIGIHVGDIIIDDNDIFGDGVNIAARLEGIAEPSGVCVSDDAYRQIRGKVEIACHDLGSQTLKNIAEPMRAWRVQLDGQIPSEVVSATNEPQAQTLPKKPSIVVLPLQNMSGDPEQEYFADGLTENLTTDLSRFGELFVIGRNTAFTYKGKELDLKKIGRELSVRYALEGSVQRGGERIRINVQLIDTQTGGHLWAERFDRDRGDLLNVQDEISRSVANSLYRQVTTAELERGKREEPSRNADADQLMLRGNAPDLWGSTPDKYAARLNLFKQAAQVDSQNVDAWAGIAVFTATRLFLGWSPDRADDLRSAIAASERALALGPSHPHANFAKGHVSFAARDYSAALEAYEHAIELNPSRSLYHHLAGTAKIALGRAQDALESLNEAVRLSPRDLFIADYFACLGMAYWELERYSEAMLWLERSRARNSHFTWANAFLASTYLRIGEQTKAEAAIRYALQAQPNWTTEIVESSYPLRPASLAALVEDLRAAGLRDE